MAKQLTAPGCIYTIVARVDTTIYSPDQTWILDVSAGQTDFIAETNEIIIPGDAMLCRKTRQHAKDRNRLNLLGTGPGSLATFVTRAIERIVGKGNAKVEYGAGTLTVALPESATTAQIAIVENLLDRMLPKDVTGEIGELPLGYIRVEYLANTSKQYIDTGALDMYAYELDYSKLGGRSYEYFIGYQVKNTDLMYGCPAADNVAITDMTGGKYARTATVSSLERHTLKHSQKMGAKCYIDGLEHSTVAYGGHAANADATEKDISLYLFGAHNADGLYRSDNVRARIYSFIAWDVDENLIGNFRPALDNIGTPCMFDTVTRKPVYKAVTTGPDFIVGLTITQALNLANLPATGGSLTVSLPLEAAFDANVESALNTATAKGWTITVQYRASELTTDHIEADFLESTGTQYIDTGLRYSTSDTYSQTLDLSITDKMHAGYTGVNWLGWANVENGVYKMLKLGSAPIGDRDIIYNKFANMERSLYVNGSEVVTLTTSETQSDIIAGIFSLGGKDNTWFNTTLNIKAKLYSAKFTQNGALVRDMLPALSPAGTPCMFDKVSKTPFYNAGTGAFIIGFETAEKAAVSLSKLPRTTDGTLTVSLPYEASIDRLAQTALERARANGWELTLQYAESDVPAGYRKLDFLESTGTQYIDTEYVPNNETGIYLHQLKTSIGDFVPMGCRNSELTESRFYALRSMRYPYDYHQGSGFGWGSWIEYPTFYGLSKIYTNYMNNRVVAAENSDPIAVETLPFTLASSIFMFAANIGGEAKHIWSGRIYEAVISQGEAIAMSFVPCITPDGKLGMYNKIDGTLYENAGTGSFIAGLATVDDVLNLWLPETNGTLTVSVPAGTPDSAVTQLRQNNPTWQIAIQFRTDDEN